MWEYEKRHGSLPDGSDAQTAQLQLIADTIWEDLGINKKGIQGMDKEIVQYVFLSLPLLHQDLHPSFHLPLSPPLLSFLYTLDFILPLINQPMS
jgi:hypothetical protein